MISSSDLSIPWASLLQKTYVTSFTSLLPAVGRLGREVSSMHSIVKELELR
jgi:hypothetical protein